MGSPGVRRTTLLFGLLVALLPGGCGNQSLDELRDSARGAIDRGDYALAVSLCDRSLGIAEVGADDAQRWFFERTRLDALASQGQGADVLESLDSRFRSGLAPRLDAPLYARLANRLQAGGDINHAIDTVNAGMLRFPEREADFADVLQSLNRAAQAAAEQGDNSSLEHLRQLGYLK